MVASATEREEEIVGAHFAYLVGLRDRGILILAGRTQVDEGTFGLVIYEADDEEAARRIATSDPSVDTGVFTAEVYPYAVAVAREDLTGLT